MRVVQIVGGVSFGDAIGYHVLSIKKYLSEYGINNCIVTNYLDKRLPEDTAVLLSDGFEHKEDDIILFHMASAIPLNRKVTKLPGKKVLMYHNITPPHFFHGFNEERVISHKGALDDLVAVKDSYQYCIAMSEFNKSDLIKAGYNEKKISVMPSYFIPFEDYLTPPNMKTMENYSDGWINIIFVGRIAPNKKHEDIIQAFAYYKKHINSKARLIIIGSSPFEKYKRELDAYIKRLDLHDVIFPGHISFQDIVALYKTATVFLCMSEHEGFCVPLVEAMFFGVPIIAYDSCAVPETLGETGILVDEKNPVLIAKCIERITLDHQLRDDIIQKQKNRLLDFQQEKVALWLINYLNSIK